MSILLVAMVGLGGALGALARAMVGRWIRSDFPFATLTINVAGCFILTAAYALLPADAEVWRALVGAGFCGAFTTFSTFILEAVLLARSGHRRWATLYLIATLSLCSLASLTAFHLIA